MRAVEELLESSAVGSGRVGSEARFARKMHPHVGPAQSKRAEQEQKKSSERAAEEQQKSKTRAEGEQNKNRKGTEKQQKSSSRATK